MIEEFEGNWNFDRSKYLVISCKRSNGELSKFRLTRELWSKLGNPGLEVIVGNFK